MRQVTFANIRAHRSRLVAVSIAVILAVAFMSATLLLASSSKATLRASIGADVALADVVVQSHDDGYENFVALTPETVEQIAALPGVEIADAARSTSAVIDTGERQEPYALVRDVMAPELEPSTLEEGAYPASAHEVVLDRSSLSLLKVELGDTITLKYAGAEISDGLPMTIVGIAEASKNPFSGGFVEAIISPSALDAFVGQAEAESPDMMVSVDPSQVLVKLDPATTVESFRESLTQVTFVADTRQAGVTPLALTPDELVEEQVNSFTNDTNMLTAVLLAFVGVALFVAGLVISNTFSVLIAQRARELALLRCVGASSSQVRRSVFVEAFVMALVSSVIGVGLAIGLLSGLIWLSGETGLAGGVGVFAIGWEAIVLPIIAGIIVTLIAANGPAREATRVAPLEALRSRSTETLTRNAGRVRLIIGLVFLALGIGVIAMGLMIEDPVLSLVTVLLGSVVSAVGVLMLTVFVVPPVTHALGRIFFLKGVPGKLAALNSIRNPKRTAATASALLVGVTLVATVYTGAEVARATLTNELASSFPVDMAVVIYDPEGAGATGQDAVVSNIESVDGIEEVVQATSASVSTDQESFISDLWGVDPGEFALVTQDHKAVLRAGETLLGSPIEGNEVTLTGEAGSLTLTSEQAGAPRYTALVTPEDFAKIAGDPEESELSTWVALIKTSEGLSTQEILDIRDELTSIVPSSYVIGEGIERAMFDEIIQMLLLIVTALLAVAVIIAVIGIGNTLSLSVIERTRENALLRALGLTRGQLRGMLAAEALLTAVTAAVLGVVLGVLYGFAGASAVLGAFGNVAYDLPWVALAVILVAALAAGLIASVMPARRAVKLSPVEGLQTA